MNSMDTLKELASCKPGKVLSHKTQVSSSAVLAACVSHWLILSLASVSIFLEQWCYTVIHPIQIHPEIITYAIPKA